MVNLASTFQRSFATFLAKPANILVPVILFIVLSPGVLISIPEIPDQVSILGLNMDTQILTHAAIFAVVYFLLRTFFRQFYY